MGSYSLTARCGVHSILLKAVSLSWHRLAAVPPSWPDITATKKPAPGRDRLVPPYRFSMLDRGRPTEYSVGCSRGRLRTVPGARSPTGNYQIANHCNRSIADTVFGC